MFYGKWKHKAQNNANTHLAHAQSIRKQQKRHSRKIQRHCSTIQCNESLNKPKEYLPPPEVVYPERTDLSMDNANSKKQYKCIISCSQFILAISIPYATVIKLFYFISFVSVTL
jgi:hypothetical protein